MRDIRSAGETVVGSFGERLRREREMRGVSLDDIAEATKIGTRLLRALEEEHFELLPGGIFNKGFVRAYSKYLGLNAEEAVADYLEAAGESTPDPRVIAEQNSSRVDRTSGDSGDSRAAGFPVIPVLILLLVIAAGAGGWQIYQERMRDRQARQDAARAAAASVSPSAASTTPGVTNSGTAVAPSGQLGATSNNPAASTPISGVTGGAGGSRSQETKNSVDLNTPTKASNSSAVQHTVPPLDATKPKTQILSGPDSAAAGTAAPNAQSFEVTVTAKDRAWISIKSDGKVAVAGIISPPDVKTVHATGQVVFYTGNAGAVEVSFNGQLVPLAGGANHEGVLVFNSHGVVIPKPALPNQQP